MSGTDKMALSSMMRFTTLTLFAILVALSFDVSCSIKCDSTTTCERLLQKGSECINGQCSNPFASGCLMSRILQQHHQEVEQDDKVQRYTRACNSEDSDTNFCSISKFNYTEVRISVGNWESSIFLSWIIQILLSELLNVPVTIETGNSDDTFSFYDNDPTTLYFPDEAYNWDSILESNRVGGYCQDSSSPCAHFMPEVWNGQEAEWLQARSRGDIEPVEGNGMVGEFSLYIPKFVAERDPSLVSFFGLRGPENQQKLAETFKRPTTWGEYCSQESPSNCTGDEDDRVAVRPPNDSNEANMYFAQGRYTGFFRYTPENNCTLNPDTCTGHIVDAQCSWSAYTTSQLYWNEIYLESNGPLIENNGYSYANQIEIWQAANATNSSVVMLWFRPDLTRQIFRNSDSEFQTVILPEPTYECTRNRVNSAARCSFNVQDRRGSEKGSCDYDPHALQKITAHSLIEMTRTVPEAVRSPAYDMLRSIQVSNLAIEDMFNAWSDNPNGMDGYTAREAVCEWVSDNIDLLQRYVPLGFPRQVQDGVQYSRGATYAAVAVGALVTFVVVMTALVTYHKREERIMVYAQPIFLLLILNGLLLVAVGATIFPMEPSNASCIAKHWLIGLGYTLGLVPLLVKVAAINTLFRHSERMRRVKLSPKRLFSIVAVVSIMVIVYLTIWTVVDPPIRNETWVLIDAEQGIVEAQVECASSSDVWLILALGWNTLLLVCATVLSFQSRNIRQEFNESRTLAVMTYSHFIFLIMTLTMYGLQSNFTPSTLAVIVSFLFSVDTLSALVIYFLPKFLVLFNLNEPLQAGRRSNTGSSLGGMDMFAFDETRRDVFSGQAESNGINTTPSPEKDSVRAEDHTESTRETEEAVKSILRHDDADVESEAGDISSHTENSGNNKEEGGVTSDIEHGQNDNMDGDNTTTQVENNESEIPLI